MAVTRTRTVAEFLAELPEERRNSISALREAVVGALPAGLQERVSGSMINYEVPLDVLAETYNGQPLMFAAIAAQKNHDALYLMSVYMNPELEQRLRGGFAAAGVRLDMGKSCIRFRKPEEMPLEVIGEIVSAMSMEDFVRGYVEGRS